MRPFAPLPPEGYLVGGALRDALLGRPFSDLDWLVPDPQAAACALQRQLGGSAFALDEARGHWRLVSGDVVRDFTPLLAPLEQDLAARDYTINALAADRQGRLIDPLGGYRDLKRRQLRAVHPDNLRRDPLRPLRGVRLAAQLALTIAPETQQAMAAVTRAQTEGKLPLPAWERVRDELDRLLLCRAAGRGVALLDGLGLLELYLPELAACRGVAQGGFHHLDVLAHTLEALNQLVQGFPAASLAARWATLLHDIGKPECRSYDAERGHYRFLGHDRRGAELARRCLKRLRQPEALVGQVAQLVRYHMLPLPHSERAARRFVHRRRALLPELLQLMLADREAARGPLSSEAARRAYRLAVSRVLAAQAETPEPPPLLDGHEVMALLGIPSGPKVGAALRFVREAAAVGDIRTPEEAKAALQRYAARQGWLDGL